jgi:hypothetical protein
MKTQTVTLKVLSFRRRPISGHKGVTSYSMFVQAEEIPDNFPDENVRSTTDTTSKQVYKEVVATLLGDDGQPGSFVFKNLGVRVLADSVDFNESTSVVTLENARTANGAHTVKILKDNKHILLERIAVSKEEGIPPLVQLFDLRVDVGIPIDWETDIVQANNNTVGVRKLALAEHQGYFKWMKSSLPQPFLSKIDFRDEGATAIDITEVLCIATLFNITLYPNTGTDHPISAYSSARSIIDRYVSECKKTTAKNESESDGSRTTWAKLGPILPDILVLRDLIASTARDLYQGDEDLKRKGGRLSFVIYTNAERKTPTGKDRKPLPEILYPFLEKSSVYGLMKGALMPILASFRALVELGDDGNFKWSLPFEKVKEIWTSEGENMMMLIKQASNGGNTSIDTIAKNPNTWLMLYQTVKLRHQKLLIEQKK